MGGLAGISFDQVANAVTNFSLPLMATPSDLYASMLVSDVILEAVIDSLGLTAQYGRQSSWQAVRDLRDDLQVTVEPEGIITVKATGRSPEQAAAIANLLINELNRFNLQLSTQKNDYYVDFYGERLRQTSDAMDAALEDLKNFQEQHKAIALDLQSAALIENLAATKATLTDAEIQVGLLRETLGPSHPKLVEKQAEVREIRRKLHEIEDGAPEGVDSVLSILDLPLSRIPDLSLQLSVLTRNVRVQEVLYELLAQKYELAGLEAKLTAATIDVLDIARPPLDASYPRRIFTTFAAAVVGFMLSVLLALLYARHWADDHDRQRTLGWLRQALPESGPSKTDH